MKTFQDFNIDVKLNALNVAKHEKINAINVFQ